MPVLEVKNLSFGYNGAGVLKNVSFSLDKGDFTGILGHNGSGKSTLLKIISGILTSDSGAILLNGKPVLSYSRQETARLIGHVPSEIFVPYEFTVFETVLMGRSPYLNWWQGYGRRDFIKTHEVLERAGISHLKNRHLNSLSSGEKQLVFIAQALAQEPEILILDEPTSHLDINHKIEIFALLSGLIKEKGISVIVVTHDLNLAAGYCNKILLLRNGETIYFGNTREGLETEKISRSYGVKNTEALKRIMKGLTA
ncbi:MAG: ABC transporter ATP-binding protein [Elusimicrobia bacterium]|nr:ABC transporter ATP-binding protein [Elusimicrobiota bacterium]